MPLRIKPIHKLKPCLLDLNSIKSICELVQMHYPELLLFAQDKFWEIYDERELSSFLKVISEREKLDSFSVEGYEHEVIHFGGDATETGREEMGEEERVDRNEISGSMYFTGRAGITHFTGRKARFIKIEFSQDFARVSCEIPPNQSEWFEHFMIDLNKYLKPATFSQIIQLAGNELPAPYKAFIPSVPYCRIVIRRKTPDPFIEGIKVNLVSNIIWAILGIIIGFIAAFSTGLISQIFSYVSNLFR
jgi:hypothetical protein